MNVLSRFAIHSLFFLLPSLISAQKETVDSLCLEYRTALSLKRHDTIILKLKLLIAWDLRGANPDSSIIIAKEVNENIIDRYFKSSFTSLLLKARNKEIFSKTDACYLDLLGESYHSMGVYFNAKGAYNTSLQNNFKALKIWNILSVNTPDKFLLKKSSSYGNIGILFEELGDNLKALYYFNKCLKIKQKLRNKKGIALTYGSIGNVYYSEGKKEEAANYYKKTIKLLLEEKDEFNASSFMGNLAVIYLDRQNYSEAINLFTRALLIDKKLNKKRGEAIKLGNIGFTYLKMKQFSQAEKYLTEALAISTSLNLNNIIPDHHLFLSQLFEARNHNKLALFHYKKYVAFLDSIQNDEVIRKQTRLEAEFEFEIKQEIQKKEQEKKQVLLLAEKNRQKYISLLLVALIVIVLLIVSFVINSIKKQKKQVELTAAKHQLEIEYKLLRTQMNPHFIFNVLNSIHQYINQVNNEQASNLLLKFSKLIRTILQHSTREEIPLNEEVDQIKLYISIEEIRFSNQFSSIISIDSSIQTDEIQVPTMIIQPFIENAIIHGISGLKDRKGLLRINIQCINETYLQIVIEDNGNGIYAGGKKESTHESLSMKLIEERLKLIDSKGSNHIKIEEINPGTRVTVRIPYQSIY